jgi:hypothetical protein
MEALHSSEMLVLTRATRPYIQEDGIIRSYRRENLKSNTDVNSCALKLFGLDLPAVG